MKISKSFINKSMRLIGIFALFLGTLAITPNSTSLGQQPECPDELLG